MELTSVRPGKPLRSEEGGGVRAGGGHGGWGEPLKVDCI